MIGDLFGGRFFFESKCSICNYMEIGFENFLNVLVYPESPPKSYYNNSSRTSVHLNELINSLSKEDRVDASQCKNCRRKTSYLKTNFIDYLPQILCIVIKRFKFEYGSFSKNDVQVRIPSFIAVEEFPKLFHPKEGLQNRIPPFYELSAILNHFGSFESGHYTW